MAPLRPSCLRGALGRTTLRRVGAQSRSNAFRQGGRRTYADAHGAKKSSDIPWIIGSAAVTIPCAAWLLGQTPTKSDHHHETEPKVVEESEGGEGGEKKEEDGGEDSKDESKGDDKEESKTEGKSDDSKDEAKDGAKSDDSGSEDEGKDTPDTSDDEDAGGSTGSQINKIGQSKSSKPRNPTETKGEKDSAKDHSGAQHPYIDDESKSKKAEGVVETAKIHGTVDPKRNSSKP